MENDNQIICDIEDYLSDYIEIIFENTCRNIQKDWAKERERIRGEVVRCFKKVWEKTVSLQDCNRKGTVKYWLISIQRSSLLWDEIAFRVETFDDGFFLDDAEAVEEYQPEFIKAYWNRDLEQLSDLLKKRFVRIQKYQHDIIREVYSPYYYAVIYQLLKALLKGIMKEVCVEKERICKDYKVIFGFYMGQGTVLYEGEGI